MTLNRRGFLSGAAASTATLLAGCSDEDSVSETPSKTTPRVTDPLTQEAAISHLERVYRAWVSFDADAFLATLHSTNNHPEEEVRNNARNTTFDGDVTSLNAEVANPNVAQETIQALFESTRNLSGDDAAVFKGVQNVVVRVSPVIAVEPQNKQQASLERFFETSRSHFLAVEDGEWRFVM